MGSCCLSCGTVYVTACPRCGNRVELEEIDLGPVRGLRCPRCDNTEEFRVTVLPVDG